MPNLGKLSRGLLIHSTYRQDWWSAQSTVFQAPGVEYPTTLHRHLSGLLLLAPTSKIQEFPQTTAQRETVRSPKIYLY